MKIDRMDTFELTKHVRVEFFNSEALVINLEKEAIFSLNDSSADILKFICEGKSYMEIIKTVHEKYDVDIAMRELEINDFLLDLISEGVIRRNVR